MSRLIGSLLRSLRVERDLTIEALAARSGVSARAISDIERGVRAAPRRGTVTALADALHLGGGARTEFFDAARHARTVGTDVTAVAAARPHRVWDFAGRGAELDAIDRLLAAAPDPHHSSPPIVLSGLPGAGKTSTALEAVRRSGADVQSCYVNLLGASAAPLAPLDALRTLLLQHTGELETPTVLAGAQEAWRRATAEGTGVIVLDDAGSEAQVRPILDVGPGYRVLVTSRRSLAGLEAAHHIAVGPLPRQDSTAFLRNSIPAPQRTEDDVRELAALSGDLPLALRIVAGRVAAQPSTRASDLVRRLRSRPHRLPLFTAGDLEVERAFAASYALLSEQQQQTFRDLALLPPGSFPAAAAGATRGLAENEAREALEELAELGLAEPLARDRYRLHDLLRLFAATRLEQEEADLAALRLQVERWYLDGAARAVGIFTGQAPEAGMEASDPSRPAAAAWLRDEAGGWFEAFSSLATSGRDEELLDYAARIGTFVEAFLDWGRWHDFFGIAAAAASRVGDVRARAKHLADLATADLEELFDEQRAIEVGTEAAELAERIGEPRTAGEALSIVGMAFRRLGEQDRAVQALTRAATLCTAAGDRSGELDTRYMLADWRADEDPAAAETDLREVLAGLRELSDGDARHRDIGIQTVLVRLAHIHLITARPRTAIDLATEAIDAAPLVVAGVARARAQRGLARSAAGDPDRALEDLHAALELAGSHRPQFWVDGVEQAIRASESAISAQAEDPARG